MEIFILYGKSRKYLSSNYEILVDSVKYSLDRNKSYDDNSAKLSNVFDKYIMSYILILKYEIRNFFCKENN